MEVSDFAKKGGLKLMDNNIREKNKMSGNYRSDKTTVRSVFIRNMALAGTALIGVGLIMRPCAVRAAQFQYGNVNIELDSNLEYSVGLRTSSVDYGLLNTPAGAVTDDGDRDFRQGIIENQITDLEQLDVTDGNYGFHASAEAYLNTVFLHHNQNNSPFTVNSFGPNDSFPSGTVAEDGRTFRPLTAFVFGTQYFNGGNSSITERIGRQTITWGESLFVPDGISGGQAPFDVNYAEEVPNLKVQSYYLPTAAAAVTYTVNSILSFSAYEKFEFEPDILPGVGSFFSPADFIGPGAENEEPAAYAAFGANFGRIKDIRTGNGLGQFGVSVHEQAGELDLGQYYVRFDSPSPEVFTFATKNQYAIAYAQNINLVGASFDTDVSDAEIGGEISGRWNQPLSGNGLVLSGPAGTANNIINPLGDVIDAQISETYASEPLPLAPNGITVASELIYNKVVAVTRNPQQLVAGSTDAGAQFVINISPTYYWFPQTAISPSFSWGNAFVGHSRYDASEQAGTGDFSMGISAVYRTVWTVGLAYTRHYGSPIHQGAIDRDFATFNIQRAF